MSKKKISYLIIGIIIVAFLAIWGIIKSLSGATGVNKPPEKVIIPKFQTIYNVIDNCKDKNDINCKNKDLSYYRIDDFNKNPDFKKIISKINSYYLNRPSEIENLMNNDPACNNVKNIYNYRYSEKGSIYYFVNDTIAVVTQDLISKDLCLNKDLNPKFEVYYYDIKWQKMTDVNGLLNLLNLKKSVIESKIRDYLIKNNLLKDQNEFINLLNSEKIKYELFIDNVGNLMARYTDNRDSSFTTIQLMRSKKLGLKREINE